MIRTRESIAAISLMAILACSCPAGTEPNDANAPLEFEVSSVEQPIPRFTIMWRGTPSPWRGMVTYAAGIAQNKSPYFPDPRRQWGDDFIRFAQSQKMSEKQRRLLEDTQLGLGMVGPSRLGPVYSPPEDPNTVQLLLYAVNLDDAKEIAQAYLQYAQDKFRKEVETIQDRIKKLSTQLADEQQKLSGAIQAYEAAKKAFEDLQKQVPYRDDKQALDAAAELDKMLNTAQVDIAGIRAKIEAIQGYQKSEEGDRVLTPKLAIMFIEEAVAMKGAEARKSMATTLRKQADSYIDLKAARDAAELERDRLTHAVSVLPDMIREAQQKLAEEMENEPRVINNKVFIYPVKPEGQSLGQPLVPRS